MRQFETLDRFTTPDGRRLALYRRDDEYIVNLEGDELMSSRAPDSEGALAELACAGLSGRPRVLIGGLGLGFTLRAALDVLPAGAEVVVAELFAKVIEWNRDHLSQLQGDALTDPRTNIVHADVWDQVRGGGPWDAILLDVDNGPDAFCFASNSRLYDLKGLLRIQAALAPGGVVAFWSSEPDERFVKMLDESGFDARSHTVEALEGSGIRHTIFVARLEARDR